MLIHLKHVSANIPKGKHAVIIMDQASWHTTKSINIFNNITIIHLPPASPELNPVEQIWQHLRRRELSNRCFKDYEYILSSCSDAWNNFTNKKGFIKSLCDRKWTKNFND